MTSVNQYPSYHQAWKPPPPTRSERAFHRLVRKSMYSEEAPWTFINGLLYPCMELILEELETHLPSWAHESLSENGIQCFVERGKSWDVRMSMDFDKNGKQVKCHYSKATFRVGVKVEGVVVPEIKIDIVWTEEDEFDEPWSYDIEKLADALLDRLNIPEYAGFSEEVTF